ncbi:MULTISPECIES: acetyl/propionyl/methylcrotonyl-CoA carboxylase subunit alpha [unclassified Acinetobacter]|uniref:acetyl/propionyl/methylcrotonyl-CoA carboxylase subunit alpha n=1 Tax=unclassified Acinetobacter TaxID=196816 RepID=UPI002934E1B6|nr:MULTISPECIES: acetyl/propionyl/methylcrotonyl-CoA carboxylase subunit alpha [unclassified Acinetobacter]WOE33335.1 acetyl/propionyl/methylcrotonyl-CoA carboxylase subunit alpha [Acinetobacter sp. SAAs470]WOE37006.1 acetyl/propionyl/methylcrotonyl-CoA carboxylase subunit alpha [Acinetobacter sp. SAAs474]
MFEKILIANRGEIACRIIRTAKKLGIVTVAVYSDADAQAQHVKLADEAIYIGESAAAQSYLQIERIIAAAQLTGAQAIHPGYGFLSENDQFALACQNNHIVFIGPPVEAILAMGLKATSKSLMEKAGVPLTPGYHGQQQEPEFLKQQADQIGYPVLIKASAGGGGKGMRLVEDSASFLAALSSCKSEARASFGNDDVLIERYVVQPRHIEVQVFGDQYGHYVHLFERDCSVQRRHQKVLEEAPAPNMPEDKLQAMRDAAINAARAVNYVGAGTVEFIVEQNGNAYFMEMNTRLQVEHPVTEMITGVDLVEWQLRVACGEPLPKQQHELTITGHALEARIYAEEPENDFLPAIGQISYLHYPTQNDRVRVDSGIIEGDEISTYYDPMIAKLIVWGENREAALTQMHHALSQFHVDGVGNNIAFLDRLVRCDAFKTAQLDTNLIQREEKFLLPEKSALTTQQAVSAALIELFSRINTSQISHHPVWKNKHFWRLNQYANYTVVLSYQNENIKVDFNISPQGIVANFNQQQLHIEANLLDQHRLQVQFNSQKSILYFNKTLQGITLFHAGQRYCFDTTEHHFNSIEEEQTEHQLVAPMPGVVTQVLVTAQDSVKKNDILMTLEAMKIEYAIRAPHDGIITNAYYQHGDQVKSGDKLIELQPFTEEVA